MKQSINKTNNAKPSKYLKRIFYLLPATLLLTFTIFIFAPIEMYISNADEFWFLLKDIIPVVILYFTIATVLSCVLGAFIKNKKIFYIYNAIVLGLGLGLYIQGNFLNNDYGILDGSSIEWSWYTKRLIVGLLVWALCMVLPLLFNICFKEKFYAYNRYLSIGLIMVEVITLIFLFLNFTPTSRVNAFSKENLTKLSKNKNVIVFVLDAFEELAFENILDEEDYNVHEIFKDFEAFTNCTSLYSYTDVSLPYLMTGIPYKNLELYYDYLDSAFRDTQLYKNLLDNNFSASIYTNKEYAPNNSNSNKIIDNIKNITIQPTSAFLLTNKFYQLCLFRYAPQFLKHFFWLYTDEFNEYIKELNNKDDDIYSIYSYSDLKFYNDIQRDEWNLQDKNTFKLYHLAGIHSPLSLNRNVEVETIPNDLAFEDSAIGVFKIVEKYMSIMKENNIYDDSLIIVTADHGWRPINDNANTIQQHVIFMVKQPNNENDSLRFSNAPISHVDLLPTIYEYVKGMEQEGTIYDYNNVERERIFYSGIWSQDLNGYKPDLYETIITNDPFVHYRTGVVYSQGEEKVANTD